jgi:glyoxylase-like metal-dependent hydrolase (beta-lactamase superfamily II)
MQKLTDGVYAFFRKEPPSLWFNPNNGLIVGKRYAIVIDSNISSEYTKEVLEAIRKITDKPVRYVINTHWHEDHIIGNHVYRDTFPDVKFIAQKSTVTDLPTIGAANRKSSIDNGGKFVDLLKLRVEKGLDLEGKTLFEEGRLGYLSDIDLISSYLAEAPRFQILMPDILVGDRLEINDNGEKTEVMFLGRAHTGADIVIYLPKQKIVFSGDLTVYPVPLIGSTSYPLEYADTLKKLAGLGAKTYVPGHGPVMRDTNYIYQMIDLLHSIKQQVTAAVAGGKSLEEMRKSVDLEEYKEKFCGSSAHKRFLFENYVVLPATAAAYKQLRKGS